MSIASTLKKMCLNHKKMLNLSRKGLKLFARNRRIDGYKWMSKVSY